MIIINQTYFSLFLVLSYEHDTVCKMTVVTAFSGKSFKNFQHTVVIFGALLDTLLLQSNPYFPDYGTTS